MSAARAITDARDDYADRNKAEQNQKKRQSAKGDETEGQSSEKQGYRSMTMRHEEPYACRNEKPGCCCGNPAENIPDDIKVSIFKV